MKREKDLFDIAVIILSVMYVGYLCFGVYYIVKSIETLNALSNIAGDETTRLNIIYLIVAFIVGAIFYGFFIFCIYTIGENRRNINELRNVIIKSSIIKDNKIGENKLVVCENCGAKIGSNEVVCPYCNELVGVDEEELEKFKENQIQLCEKCGYQLFPEDIVCPNCGEKVVKNKNKDS